MLVLSQSYGWLLHTMSPTCYLESIAENEKECDYNSSSATAVDTRSRFSLDSDDLVIARGVALDATQRNAGGAPIEKDSPMGRELGWWSMVLLNCSTMIGTGIFSTPGTMIKETGSVGLALVFWIIGLYVTAYPASPRQR